MSDDNVRHMFITPDAIAHGLAGEMKDLGIDEFYAVGCNTETGRRTFWFAGTVGGLALHVQIMQDHLMRIIRGEYDSE